MDVLIYTGRMGGRTDGLWGAHVSHREEQIENSVSGQEDYF